MLDADEFGNRVWIITFPPKKARSVGRAFKWKPGCRGSAKVYVSARVAIRKGGAWFHRSRCSQSSHLGRLNDEREQASSEARGLGEAAHFRNHRHQGWISMAAAFEGSCKIEVLFFLFFFSILFFCAPTCARLRSAVDVDAEFDTELRAIVGVSIMKLSTARGARGRNKSHRARMRSAPDRIEAHIAPQLTARFRRGSGRAPDTCMPARTERERTGGW